MASDIPLEEILWKTAEGTRLSDEDFLMLHEEAELHQLGIAADMVRRRKHPDPIVTYVIDRNINYTDICISACKFCAFFAAPDQQDRGYLLSFDELEQKIRETLELGGTQILLQGGLHPGQPFEYYEEMVRFIAGKGVHLHGFSPPEIWHFSTVSGLDIKTVIARLKAAGLGSIPGGGAEILSNRVRRETAPNKCDADQWIQVMEEAHRQGLRTTATMMYGHVESVEERLEHLRRLRELQDRTGGFTAFIPWPFQPQNTVLAHLEKSTSLEYLRLLALSRLYLDNFDNIQASWVTQGPKVAQLALHYGANDFGSTMIEENVVAAAGVSFRLSEQEIRRLVSDAGFQAHQRRMDYSLV